MKFYQVDTDHGPQLVVRQDEAKKLDPNYRKVEIPTDSDGLRTHLNQLMAIQTARESEQEHDADCGCTICRADAVVAYQDATKPEGYTEKSNRFEEEFAAMPLSLKLHYGSLAMEAARDQL